MFKKILIAEDLDVISSGLTAWLQTLNIETITHTKYCDDALLKIQKAILDEAPFDLLICDLSFGDDFKQTNLLSGQDLIAKLNLLEQRPKIIVYSIEDKPYVVQSLFETLEIDAFVQKGRSSLYQLKTAIAKVAENDKYISPSLAHVLHHKTAKEIGQYDIALLTYLAQGVTIEELPKQFKALNISPNSKSAIEKNIQKLKDYFRANNNIHLIAIAKDLGLI